MFLFLTAALKDKLKKSECIITSQDINLKSINEMLTYTQVKTWGVDHLVKDSFITFEQHPKMDVLNLSNLTSKGALKISFFCFIVTKFSF